MTNEEYIRKAVKLAAGWRMAFDTDVFSCDSMPAGLGFRLADSPQYAKDALAAQLVRQVDALAEVDFDSKSDAVYVWDFRSGKDRRAATAYGPDRTMNTIKAIVDSGVLENAEE